jgi:hypothetical protein
MLKLPRVTLVCVTSKNKEAHQKALDKCCEQIEFGAVLLLDLNTHTIDEWNKAIIYEMPKYIQTDFALLIHDDGYIIHPELWRDEWLEYDYLGSPFPSPTDNYSYRDENGDIVRVGNSVGLRSKKLMDLVATKEWRSYYGNTNEDGFACVHHHKWLESMGCKFPPLEVAIHFGKEHEIPENIGLQTFLFHKYKYD